MIYLLFGIIVALFAVTGVLTLRLREARQSEAALLQDLAECYTVETQLHELLHEHMAETMRYWRKVNVLRSHVNELQQTLVRIDTSRIGLIHTVENMTASIKTLSNEIDERNILVAKLMLSGVVVEDGPLKGTVLSSNDGKLVGRNPFERDTSMPFIHGVEEPVDEPIGFWLNENQD